MKKFEEELKRIIFNGVNKNNEKFYLASNLIKNFKDWISPEDHQNTVASNKAYEKSNRTLSEENAKFVVENIELQKQIAEFKSQLKKQKPEIPEVPYLVAELIKKRKGNWSLFGAFRNISGNKYDNEKLYEWVFAHAGRQEIFAQAWTNGYTVKEKRFYLKHLDMSKKYNSNVCVLAHGEGDVIYGHREFPVGVFPSDSEYIFTQSEIDSMETGSYEQIEVEE